MYPYLLQSDRLTISSYPFLYGLGLTVAGALFAALLRRAHVPFRTSINFWFIVALMTVLGGRVLYVLIYWRTTRVLDRGFAAFEEAGEVLYGGLAGVIGTIWFLSWRWNLPLKALFDAAAVSAPAGVLFGRIGCLLGGCCWGAPTQSGWTVRYPKVIDVYGNVIGSPAYVQHLERGLVHLRDRWSLPCHPAPLYESLFCLLLAGGLWWLWRQRAAEGRLMIVFVLVYAIWRFHIEFLRENERIWCHLTVYQWISIALTVGAAGLLVWLSLRSGAARTPPHLDVREPCRSARGAAES
jgi:phosphatidylglycerol:prolipoprotein diacylglycerol transferase